MVEWTGCIGPAQSMTFGWRRADRVAIELQPPPPLRSLRISNLLSNNTRGCWILHTKRQHSRTHPGTNQLSNNASGCRILRIKHHYPSTHAFVRPRTKHLYVRSPRNHVPQIHSPVPPLIHPAKTQRNERLTRAHRVTEAFWPGSRSHLIILLPPARDLHIQYPVYSSAMTSVGGVGSCTAHSTPHPLPPTCFDGKDEEAPVGAALLAFCFANTGPLMTSHLQSLSQRRCGHPPPPHLRKSLTLREVHLQQAQMWETPVSMKVLCVLSRAG